MGLFLVSFFSKRSFTGLKKPGIPVLYHFSKPLPWPPFPITSSDNACGQRSITKIISHNNNHVVARAVVFTRSSRRHPVFSVFLSVSMQ